MPGTLHVYRSVCGRRKTAKAGREYLYTQHAAQNKVKKFCSTQHMAGTVGWLHGDSLFSQILRELFSVLHSSLHSAFFCTLVCSLIFVTTRIAKMTSVLTLHRSVLMGNLPFLRTHPGLDLNQSKKKIEFY